jgi:hypothetical protein
MKVSQGKQVTVEFTISLDDQTVLPPRFPS